MRSRCRVDDEVDEDERLAARAARRVEWRFLRVQGGSVMLSSHSVIPLTHPVRPCCCFEEKEKRNALLLLPFLTLAWLTEATETSTAMSDSSSDLHRSILASVSATLDERPLPDLPSSSSDAPAGQVQQDDDESGYQDGDLPDFSDPEEEDLASTASGSANGGGGGPRLVPGKARGGAGGMRGKGKIPLSALKNRIQTGASKAKAAVSSSNKPLPSTPSASSSALVTTEEPSSSKGKGKSKALKLSNAELDKIAERIKAENPSIVDLDRNQVVELLEQLQIDEDFVKGKKGIMNKGAKDTGSFKFWKTQPVVSLETSTYPFPSHSLSCRVVLTSSTCDRAGRHPRRSPRTRHARSPRPARSGRPPQGLRVVYCRPR
jgi:hypothetical protein